MAIVGLINSRKLEELFCTKSISVTMAHFPAIDFSILEIYFINPGKRYGSFDEGLRSTLYQ